jgi:hypothetical protein
MDVTVTLPVAHPTLSCVGKRCGVDLGPHDNTAGRSRVVVVVVDPRGVVVEAPAAVDFVVAGEDLESRCNPIASPMPTAARTATMKPTVTTVLRRNVIVRWLSFTMTQRYLGITHHDEGGGVKFPAPRRAFV